MEMDFHLHKVQALSPKAAKIALRMLDNDPHVPTEWVMSLRPALVMRSNDATGFAGTDWMTMVSIERPGIRKFTERFESREQRHARLWVTSLRQASRAALQAQQSTFPDDIEAA